MPEPGRRAILLAGGVFAALGIWACYLGLLLDRPWVVVGMVPVIVVPFLAHRPVAAGVALALGGLAFRVAVFGTGPQTDQIETTRAALRLVLDGGNPYGAAIVGTSTGAPFPYGPLALLAYLPGGWTEVAAATGTMLLMAWARAPVAVALYAATPELIRASVMGTNDILPGLFVTAALLALAVRPAVAGALLGLAVAVKPYALAWVPGVLVAGGWSAAGGLLAVSLVAWAPLLLWGVDAFVRSVTMADELHRVAPDDASRDLRAARLLVFPAAALAALAAHRHPSFEVVAVGGTLVFLVAILLADAGSLAYLLVPLPAVLIIIEQGLRRRSLGRRRDSAS